MQYGRGRKSCSTCGKEKKERHTHMKSNLLACLKQNCVTASKRILDVT